MPGPKPGREMGGGGGGGGVRKTINVDLTSGQQPWWVTQYKRWGVGVLSAFGRFNQWGVGCAVRFQPIN